MKLVTDVEYSELMTKIRGWSDKHGMFSDAKGIARYAVMEYLLNQEGKNMYLHLVKEDV